MLTPDRWSAVERLYHAALEQDPNERDAYLRVACSGDDEVRREVESLLANEGGARFLSTPALAFADQDLNATSSPIDEQLGQYTLGELLGAGGMGEVYRARDSKLGRDVAIKFLPRALALDPDRLARFQREARTLASLESSSHRGDLRHRRIRRSSRTGAGARGRRDLSGADSAWIDTTG